MTEKVLICDDSEYIRLNIKKILDQMGHEVVDEAKDGKDAIDKFVQHRPTLVTMDIIMPNMNGLQPLQEILDIIPETKVVIVTAMTHQPIIKRALKMGAMGFITKPFTTAEFSQGINSVL